jgi:pyruvate-ferredoxin/flavodoxin oxidoreductase
MRDNPEEAKRLAEIAQQTVQLRWNVYEKMAGRSASDFPLDPRRE